MDSWDGDWKVRAGDNRITELVSAFGHVESTLVNAHLDEVHEGADLGITYNNQGQVMLNPRYQDGETSVGIGLMLEPDLARQVAKDLEAAADAAEEHR